MSVPDTHTSGKFTCSHSGEKLPDPVDLLRRIAAMEATIASLQSECIELNQLRQVVAGNTTSLLLKNYEAIQEVSVHTMKAEF